MQNNGPKSKTDGYMDNSEELTTYPQPQQPSYTNRFNERNSYGTEQVKIIDI